MANPYSALYEKLQIAHPLVQRFAVRAIFERLGSGPSHTGLSSPLGEEALGRCLKSPQPSVIDQTVKEICALSEEGKLSVEKSLLELQVCLDSVCMESVSSVVSGIGYICRLFLKRVAEGEYPLTTSTDLQAISRHPLVKCFQSREEGHQDILRQVVMVLQTSTTYPMITLRFLQPLLSFVFLQPSASPAYVVFARSLHSQLTLVGCCLSSQYPQLIKLLISYIKHYPMHTAQEHEVAFASCKELVDALECLFKQAKIHSEVKQARELGAQLFSALIEFCQELKVLRVSSVSALVLVKRVTELLRKHGTILSFSVGDYMVAVAHMLGMSDLEQEQLLLLDLGLGWLEEIHSRGKEFFDRAASNNSVVLGFIFPTIHVMSYPSTLVKSAALKLLQLTEGITEELLQYSYQLKVAEAYQVDADIIKWGGHYLAVVVHRLFESMVTKRQTLVSEASAKIFPSRNISFAEKLLTNITNLLSIVRPVTVNVAAGHGFTVYTKDFIVSICTVITMLLLHPNNKVAIAASEALAAVGKAEPVWGVSLLPVVLYSLRFRGKFKSLSSPNTQMGLLKVLPSLACHQATLPLVIQALQPMLDFKSNLAVEGTALRLLCKTWEFTNRAFTHLEKGLQPQDIINASMDGQLSQCRAACIRDICSKDPDRGVDLILSVQACIESNNSTVLALGLQSLACLCKEDVIDFYTAWLVISKLLTPLPTNPVVLQSLCTLLQYGALDAAAYPEAATEVLKLLWAYAARKGDMKSEDIYWRARTVAWDSLSSYEVEVLVQLFPDYLDKLFRLYFSEVCPAVLQSCEGLLVKTLSYEHSMRYRGQREVKLVVNKLTKLLKSVYGSLFTIVEKSPTSRIKGSSIGEFPGAMLLCSSIPPAQLHALPKKDLQKAMRGWLAEYYKQFLEIAERVYSSGNLVVAMLSVQSWFPFMSRWLQATISAIETEHMSHGTRETHHKAARTLFKILHKTINEGVPRVVETATLALAALCKVMPPSAHEIVVEISLLLESQILQEGHEYMQWSASVGLGVVSTCLHQTDWDRKAQIIKYLLKYAGLSDRAIVRAACSFALGIACQSLLNGETGDNIAGLLRARETELLIHVVLSLMKFLSKTCPSAGPSLEKVIRLLKANAFFNDDLYIDGVPDESRFEEVWEVVGLVWAIGSSIISVERLNSPTLVLAITELLISWIPEQLSEHTRQAFLTDVKLRSDCILELSMAAGACLVLSTCVEVVFRLEILRQTIDKLLHKVHSFIADSSDLDRSGVSGENWLSLLLASVYIGAGNLLAMVLQDGAYSLKVEVVKDFMKTMEEGYTNQTHGAPAKLGAMIGISNALGAGVMTGGLLKRSQKNQQLQFVPGVSVESGLESVISRPLSCESSCEELVLTLVTRLWSVAQSDEDFRLRSYAGWALAFTHFSFLGGSNQIDSAMDETRGGYHMRSLQELPEDSSLRLLSSKLISYGLAESSASMPQESVVSILRCLEKAPRLPALDWGGLARRLMRQKQTFSQPLNQFLVDGNVDMSKQTCSFVEKEVRIQCVMFALAHAEQVPALAGFLDELSELSRLSTLEAPLQNLLMCHLVDFHRIFSHLRLKQLLRNIVEFVTQPFISRESLNDGSKETYQNSADFRRSVWKGLYSFFGNPSVNSSDKVEDLLDCLEECIKVMIDLLPSSCCCESYWLAQCSDKSCTSIKEEWTAAMLCLSKCRRTWMLQILEVPKSPQPSVEKDIKWKKAIFARCQLVATGCLASSELKSSRIWLINQRFSEVLSLLLSIAWAMKQATLEEKREWLLDILDAACISLHHSALILLGLLASCWSNFAPLLLLNPAWAVQDLPLTLPPLLSQAMVLKPGAKKLTCLYERLMGPTSDNGFEELETVQLGMSLVELSIVIARTCIKLKLDLPFESRIKLGGNEFS